MSTLIGVRFIQYLKNALLKQNAIIFNADLFIEYTQQMNSCLKLIFLKKASAFFFWNEAIETMKHLMWTCNILLERSYSLVTRFKYHYLYENLFWHL